MESLGTTPPKFNMVHLKMMVSKFGISFSRDFFSGSMLNFRGVFPLASVETIQIPQSSPSTRHRYPAVSLPARWHLQKSHGCICGGVPVVDGWVMDGWLAEVVLHQRKLIFLNKWMFPKIGVPKKWMVCNGKSLLKWMIWGYHHFRKHPNVVYWGL